MSSILIPIPLFIAFGFTPLEPFCVLAWIHIYLAKWRIFLVLSKEHTSLTWRFETVICSKNVLSSWVFCLMNEDFFFGGFTFFKKFSFSFIFFHYMAGSVPTDPLLFILQLASQISSMPQRTRSPSWWVPGINSQFQLTPRFSTGLLS